MKFLILFNIRSVVFILIFIFPSEVYSIYNHTQRSFFTEFKTCDSTVSNDGTDPSLPVSRIDLQNDFYWDWFEFKDDRFFNVSILNAGKTFYGGKLYFLFRLPFVLTNLTFETQTGLGDISFDVQYSTNKKNKLNIIAGSEFIFPTESSNETGFGKFIAGPYAGVIDYFKSGYYGLIITEYFSYAGQNNRNDIHELSLNPLFKVDLGKNWYTIITPDVRYNFNSTKFFIPYTQEIGKLFSENFSASLKAGFHIKNDNKYDILAELKFSFLL